MLKHAIKFILALIAASFLAGFEILLLVAPLALTLMKANALWLLLYFATAPVALTIWAVNSRVREILQRGGNDE